MISGQDSTGMCREINVLRGVVFCLLLLVSSALGAEPVNEDCAKVLSGVWAHSPCPEME